MPTQQSLLIVITKPPYQGQAARESLDAILTAAAFETDMAVVFIGDGVYQLLSRHQGQAIEAKDLASSLAVLPIYDVDQLFVDRESLSRRGITEESLLLPTQPLDAVEVQALIDQYDKVLSF